MDEESMEEESMDEESMKEEKEEEKSDKRPPREDGSWRYRSSVGKTTAQPSLLPTARSSLLSFTAGRRAHLT